MLSSSSVCKGIVTTFLILQTFSVLLCTSTYINHHALLKHSNMGEYVRHRIKRTIIPSTSSQSHTTRDLDDGNHQVKRLRLRSIVSRQQTASRAESRSRRSIHSNSPSRSFPFQQRRRTNSFQEVESLINLVNMDDGATQAQRVILEETLLASLLDQETESTMSRQPTMEASTSSTSPSSSSIQSLNLDHINSYTPSPSHSSNNIRHHRGDGIASLSQNTENEERNIEIVTMPAECPTSYCMNGGACTVRGPIYECMCTSSYSGRRCQSLNFQGEPEGNRGIELQHYARWAIGWLTPRHGIRHTNRFQH